MECFNEESARPGGLFHLSEDMLQVSSRGREGESYSKGERWREERREKERKKYMYLHILHKFMCFFYSRLEVHWLKEVIIIAVIFRKN